MTTAPQAEYLRRRFFSRLPAAAGTASMGISAVSQPVLCVGTGAPCGLTESQIRAKGTLALSAAGPVGVFNGDLCVGGGARSQQGLRVIIRLHQQLSLEVRTFIKQERPDVNGAPQVTAFE